MLLVSICLEFSDSTWKQHRPFYLCTFYRSISGVFAFMSYVNTAINKYKYVSQFIFQMYSFTLWHSLFNFFQETQLDIFWQVWVSVEAGSSVSQPSGLRRDIHRVVRVRVKKRGKTTPCTQTISCQNESSTGGSVFGQISSPGSRKRHSEKGNVNCLQLNLNPFDTKPSSALCLSQSVNRQTGIWILFFMSSGAHQQLSDMLLRVLSQWQYPQHRDLGSHRLREDHPDRARPLLHRQDSRDPRGECGCALGLKPPLIAK